jgi:hypothetical protein
MYFVTKHVVPQEHVAVWAWVIGWCNFLGQAAGVASLAYTIAQMVLATVVMNSTFVDGVPSFIPYVSNARLGRIQLTLSQFQLPTDTVVYSYVMHVRRHMLADHESIASSGSLVCSDQQYASPSQCPRRCTNLSESLHRFRFALRF